jgi:hypothetical protein
MTETCSPVVMQFAYVSLAAAALVVTGVAYRFLFPRPRYIEAMKRKFVHEVIQLVQSAKGRSEKINILHTNMGSGLAGILKMNFDQQFELDVDIDMTYRPRQERDTLDTLDHSSKVWVTFTNQSKMDLVRKNHRFRCMLESLEPREAQLFLQAAKKQIKLGVSKLTLTKCFPQIFKNNN